MKTRRPTPKEDEHAPDFSELPVDKPIALYYRQSDISQVGNVAEEMQKEDLAKYLKQLGYSEENIILIDMDAGVSGTKKIDEREGMRMLYDLVAERKVGAVACFDPDRLFRDATGIEYNKFIENCRKARVIVWTPDTTYTFHHPTMGKAWIKLFRQKCEASADALDLMNRRLGGARLKLMRAGKHGGQPLPYGYMADVREDKRSPNYAKIVPFPEYAALSCRIFEVFVETGGKPRETYRRLVAEGFRIPPLSECPPPKGYRTNYTKVNANGVPSVKTIRQMVSNPFFIGHFTWGDTGEIIRWNNHEPIIPETLFWQAFNYVSKVDLSGNPNKNYVGVGRTHILKNSKPRKTERPICEGKVYVYIEDAWQKAGVRYSTQHYGGYNYAYDQKQHRPDAPSWQRVADWLDEAVVYYLRGRLLSSLSMKEIQQAIADKGKAREAERKHIERQIEDAEAQLRLREQKIARLTNLSLIKGLEREYEAIQEDYRRLLARREELAGIPDTNLDEVLARLRGINKPETLPYAELRGYVVSFIERIEVIPHGQHKGDDICIKWVDGELTEFHLPHSAGKKRGWTFAEIEAVRRGVEEGWTQRELSAACPNHTWHEIQVRISRTFGKGIKIPKTREGERIFITGLELANLTDAEMRRLSKEEQSEAWRQRRRNKVYAHERWADYCMRVLGFVIEMDEQMLLIADEGERGGVVTRSLEDAKRSGGVIVTEAAANKIISSNGVSDIGSCVMYRNPYTENKSVFEPFTLQTLIRANFKGNGSVMADN